MRRRESASWVFESALLVCQQTDHINYGTAVHVYYEGRESLFQPNDFISGKLLNAGAPEFYLILFSPNESYITILFYKKLFFIFLTGLLYKYMINYADQRGVQVL